jgi:hypothetical protein
VKIEDRIYEWIGDYVPDKDEAKGVSGFLIHHVHKYAKKCFAFGLIIGVLSTIIILKWLA